MTGIFCIHPCVHDVESFLKFAKLGNVDGLVWNDKAPDVLIATEWIYYKKKYFRLFRSLYRKSGIKVALLGEAIEGDYNIFDYVIGFSDDREDDPRYIRILSPFDFYTSFLPEKKNTLTPDSAALLLKTKHKFCNFLYTNANAHPMRDALFYKLSEYKRVDSLGKHLNNVAFPGTGYGNGHASDCIALKSPYKFSIAAENACFKGYTTEKVYTSLIAHTIPVYWGNPAILDDVNPECIVVADNLDEALERVRAIDADDKLWAQMASQPWRTPEQEKAQDERTSAYMEKFCRILQGKAGRMLAEGYHTGLYRTNFFFGRYPFDGSGTRKLRRIITKIAERWRK